MTQVAYPWVRKVEEALQQAKLIPMWTGSPPFPWKEASNQFAALFQVKTLKLSAEKTVWHEKDKLLSGLGDHPFITSFELTPLAGIGYFAMPQEDIAKLSSYLLTKDHSFKGFSDRALKEGFYTFTLLRMLQIFDQLHPFGDLSPKLVEPSPLPKEGAFCIDLSIGVNSLKLWARLICPKELHQAFLSYFQQHKPSVLTEEMAKELEVSLRVEVGNSVLKKEQWESAKAGDFIVLDRCSFDPTSGKGSGYLTLETTPLFQVRLKEGEIKIADYAFYQGEKIPEEMEEDELEIPEWAEPPDSKDQLNLVVEVGRIVISVEKLLQLKAGNTLDFVVPPEQSVDITLGGKKVAAGELLKLGELLGVRLLHINNHG
ncbi:MAG TPA: type III secretion system cytoplasmic ring protein SctQ [Rhabdochlamydiaceae bacterium]|nr:type III secretion system cytoplasmic ring protein SctQ [Rhabdochlamydiaceae bacterium]